MAKYRISPTTGLSLFKHCPRCFWIHYNKDIERPRGIFPSLPGGMDLVIKKYFDNYRGALPPELIGKVKGNLVPDLALIEKWRNWRVSFKYSDPKLDAELFGALDDCIIDEGVYIPLDYKTRGSAPKDGDSEKYYQTQLEVYGFLLDVSGYKAGKEGYLIYYYPSEVSKNGMVKFAVEPVKIEIDIARAKKTFEDAVNVLHGPIPAEHDECEYCAWASDRAAC